MWYYATLLDLHMRKIISIKEKGDGKGAEIRILSGETTDTYEMRVLAFVRLVSKNGVLDPDSIAALAKCASTVSSAKEKALHYPRSLTEVPNLVDTSRASQYIVDGREHVVPLGFVSIVLFAISLILAMVMPMQSYLIFPAVVLWVIVVIQSAIAFAATSTLFGHWKDGHYKEKMELDALTPFISDMALFQTYALADLSMWGEWLVYGTALGVGDTVERAMNPLNIREADTGVPVGVIGMNAAFIHLMHFTPPSHGGSSGGGFGGGGAVGR